MKKNLHFLLSLSFILLLASCTATGSGEPVRIALSPEVGDATKLHYTTEQTIAQKMMGMSVKVKQTTELFVAQKVEARDDKGVATVRVTYERVKFAMDNAMTGRTEYDSQTADPDEEAPAMAAGYSEMVGKSFTMQLDPKGKILKMDGVEALFEGMASKLDGMPGGDEMKSKMQASFGPESMKRNMQQLVATFPEGEVRVGETWSDKTELAGEFGLGINNTYKLESADANGLVLGLDSEITTDPDAKLDLGVMSVEYQLEGTQEGSMELDRKSGMLRRSNLEQVIKGSMKTMGMSVPITVTSTITVEPYE